MHTSTKRAFGDESNNIEHEDDDPQSAETTRNLMIRKPEGQTDDARPRPPRRWARAAAGWLGRFRQPAGPRRPHRLLFVTRADPREGTHNIDDSQGFPIERRWADGHPEEFRRIYADARVRVYRISGKSKAEATDRAAGRH